jgi:hypothetical protein
MQDRFFIVWHQEHDVLWVYSGDTGTYYYCIDNEEWVRIPRVTGTGKNSEVPAEMIDAVPVLKRLLK